MTQDGFKANADYMAKNLLRHGRQYAVVDALYASWGADFIKIDCIFHPYLDEEIYMSSAALRKAGRPIVLSLSPGPTPLDKAEDV